MTTGFEFCATCGTPRGSDDQKFCAGVRLGILTCGSASATGAAAFAPASAPRRAAARRPPAWPTPPGPSYPPAYSAGPTPAYMGAAPRGRTATGGAARCSARSDGPDRPGSRHGRRGVMAGRRPGTGPECGVRNGSPARPSHGQGSRRAQTPSPVNGASELPSTDAELHPREQASLLRQRPDRRHNQRGRAGGVGRSTAPPTRASARCSSGSTRAPSRCRPS